MCALPKPQSQYIVGIDLGTSSCSLAYIDTSAQRSQPQLFSIPQWVGQGQIDSLPILPSFCYLAEKNESKVGQFKLPFYRDESFASAVVGKFARDQASAVPDRVIHAAKSWLCHGGVDRTNAILPWHSESIVGEKRLSPVQVSALYLKHLREAWHHAFADHPEIAPLEDQLVVITLPASFDEVASALTLQAAEDAGFKRDNVRLLEEPQAAFYFWQNQTTQSLQVDDGQQALVLVCDIGGGTTDFSLLALSKEAGCEPTVRRLEVSKHILLGGDNFDLKIAYLIEQKYQQQGGKKLSPRQWAKLIADARWLKEKAFTSEAAAEAEQEYHCAIAGEGARLFAATQSVAIAKSEIITEIVEGFFPFCSPDVRPQQAPSAIKEWGLPYPYDGAITHHLSEFLRARPVDAVLFTGGSMAPHILRSRLLEQLEIWQGSRPQQLENPHYELAVCQGAALFGASLRTGQGYITSGYPRSLYVEVAVKQESDRTPRLLCVVPKGFSSSVPVPIEGVNLRALVGQPVAFTLFSSTERTDPAGAVISKDEGEFIPLPPLTTSLQGGTRKTGQELKVSLEVSLSETGLLTLDCVGDETLPSVHHPKPRWQLTFNVQNPGEEVRAEDERSSSLRMDPLAPPTREKIGELFASLYGKKDAHLAMAVKPKQLWQQLETILQGEKYSWNLQLLRSLWEMIKEGETRRGRSLEHEALWLSLGGFFLRPGYGMEGDEFRIERLWQAYGRGPFFPHEKRVEDQWWIMWRRVAGGLDRHKQEKLFNKVFPQLRSNTLSPEVLLLLGSLERVEMTKKLRLGAMLLEQIQAGKVRYIEQRMWALTRVASRRPLYGGADTIVPPMYAESWFKQLLALPSGAVPSNLVVAFVVAAGRMLGDRQFDISDEARAQFVEQLQKLRAAGGQIKLVAEVVHADRNASEQLFGEKLPPGLLLV